MSAAMQSGSNDAERLSALADGEVDGPTAAREACASWSGDAEVRRTWHTYHLIGDVMRSDDFASSAALDREFLAALQVRFSHEPVVFAPAPLSRLQSLSQRAASMAGWRRDRRWALPAALAAGFMLVFGAFSLLQPAGSPSSRQPTAAIADAASRELISVDASSNVAAADQATVLAMNPTLMRDARLDRYLAAHKQFAGSSALGVPSVFLRSATVDSEAR